MIDATKKTDGLLRMTLMGGQARAFLADTSQLCEDARAIHGLSRVAAAALGRLLTGASIMGCMLKNPTDSLTVRMQGGGPLGTLMAVAKPDASVKGYVDVPDVDLPRRNGKLDVGAAVGSRGELTVIKDLMMRKPYVGRVSLVSGEVAEDLAMYFTASEQTPSLVSLGVLTGAQVLAAGGLIIQPLPGCSEAALQSIELSIPMFEDLSATIQEYGLHGTLFQLLHHLEPEVIDTLLPRYLCDCSRERMERALISLGRAEIESMIDEQHGAQVDCHFCNTMHAFSEQDLRALIDAAGRADVADHE